MQVQRVRELKKYAVLNGVPEPVCLDASFAVSATCARVPMVFGPSHYCGSCERAAPDAPETIDDQRCCTGCRYLTIYGGSRGSASLPRRRSGSVLSLLTVYTNGSVITETKVFVSAFLVRTF